MQSTLRILKIALPLHPFPFFSLSRQKEVIIIRQSYEGASHLRSPGSKIFFNDRNYGRGTSREERSDIVEDGKKRDRKGERKTDKQRKVSGARVMEQARDASRVECLGKEKFNFPIRGVLFRRLDGW